MGLVLTGKFLWNHPLTRRHRLRMLGRVVGWQIKARLSAGPHVVDFVGGTRLKVSRGMTGATGNIYCGLHEFSEMGFVLHFLRREDLFVDVGANIGSYSILAAGVAGAQTICFEPVPGTFRVLTENVQSNGLEGRVELQNIACGSAAGMLRFTTGLDTTNHALAAAESTNGAIEVAVKPLDEALGGRVPRAMKVDVEGFETQVVAGADKTLGDERLWCLLMEAGGFGSRYGFDEKVLHQKIVSYGFRPAAYDPLTRELRVDEAAKESTDRVISLYVRNVEAVRARLQGAERRRVVGVEF